VGLVASGILAAFVLTLLVGRVGDSLRNIQYDSPPRNSQAQDGAAGAAADIPSTTLNPFNVLLLGVDQRDDPDEGVRSDTLIVVHVDPQEKWASMLSIPRDSMTRIPGLGEQKINAAYTYAYANAEELYGPGTDPMAAGGELAAETVEKFLDIRIDYIAQVDFHGFERIVDIFGGLTIDVPEPLLDPEYPTEDFGYERIYVSAGLQVLDGRTALRYARSRHSGSDFDRSCRQQRVLRAMLREVRQRNMLDQVALLPDIVEEIEQSVATTLPISDLGVLYGLAELAQSLSSDRIEQFSINPSNVRVVAENSSDIYWDEDDIDLLVERMMAGPSPEPEEEVATIQVQNGAGERGLASRVTTNLGTQGFVMVEAGDAPEIYEQSLIIDYTGRPQTLQRLADVLGIDPDYVQAEPAADAPPAPYNTDIVLVLGLDYQEQWAMISPDAPASPSSAPASTVLDEQEEDIPNLPPGCSPDF
jgi:LCP family protein required for cell wall assembly